MIKRIIITLGVILLIHTPTYAITDFRNAWRAIYPDSDSDEISNGAGCQLCHQNQGGGQPWNPYGFSIRSIYLANGFDIDEAILTAASTDHDNDPQTATSGDEIQHNFQPGWKAGNVNSVFMANGTEITNQAPPPLPSSTALDFPSDEVGNTLPNIKSDSENVAIELHEVAAGFHAPLQAVKAPGIDGSMFVVEQAGRIYRVDLTTGAKSLFLNVGQDLVTLSSGSNDERGLLGLAFHPNFASNGLFYTYQSEPNRASQDALVDFSTVAPSNGNHRTMISEYRASDPSCNSSITKQDILMIIDQPQSNHNGGDLAFGPDGLLYISLGDGGGSNDQGIGHGSHGTGRDITNALGSILRIDPLGNNASNGKYGVPLDNPYVGMTGVDEIFASGLRNPFRFSFDASTGDLYTGDVGQAQIEEINIVNKGDDLGWNWKEGSFFFYNSASTGRYISNTAPPGLPAGLTDPIAQYDHGDGVSVIGGYVYRGSQIPVLTGRYVFGEFLFRLLYLDAANNVLEFAGTGVSEYVTGFGQDADNELYAITRVNSQPSDTNGKLQKIMALGGDYTPPDGSGESAQCAPSDDLCITGKASNGNVFSFCL